MTSRPGRTLLRQAALGGALISCCTAILTVCVTLLGLQQVDGMLSGSARLDVTEAVTPAAGGEPRTFLIIGSDRRYRAGAGDARSDTMMLVRANPQAAAVTVMSIPRDWRVRWTDQHGRHHHDRINATYQLGGASLTTRVLSRALNVSVQHVIVVGFRAFRRVINHVGCVWLDIDRRYFNRNVGTVATNYADIDLQPGYQRLCGADALAYARHRHTDDDLVRAARQQDVLRAVRARLPVSRIVAGRRDLLAAVLGDLQTDIRGTGQLLELVKLGLAVADKPVSQVPFPAHYDGNYLTATEADLRGAVRRFLRPAVTRVPKPPRGDTTRIGLTVAPTAPTAELDIPARRLLTPRRLPAAARYVQSRSYRTPITTGRQVGAYRLVLQTSTGRYFGVQGIRWNRTPLLRSATRVVRRGRRVLRIIGPSSRPRAVGFQSGDWSWWVSNTLTGELTGRQLITIAASLR